MCVKVIILALDLFLKLRSLLVVWMKAQVKELEMTDSNTLFFLSKKYDSKFLPVFKCSYFCLQSLLAVPGHRLCPHSMDYSYDQSQPLGPDADLLDSATSLDKGRTVSEVVIDFVRNVSKMLDIINVTGAGLSGSKLTHAKEVILNAELLFGTATSSHYLDGMKGFLVSPHLLDELESFAHAAWKNSKDFIGLEDSIEGNQLRRFLFDFVVECLDSKYVGCCNAGFKVWSTLPLCMNTKRLIVDVAEEVRKWRDLAGMVPDEIIDWEMSHSLGKWTDFDIEAFETGAEIDGDILQILVDEIVMELSECRL